MRSPLLALSLLTALPLAATAQSVSYYNFTSDATSQISSAKTYTSAVSFGGGTSSAAGGPSINGVQFARVGTDGGLGTASGNVLFTTAAGLGTTSGVSANDGATPFGTVGITDTASGTFNMLNDFVFSVSAPTTRTITLGGLTAGNTYSLRLYARPWGDQAFPERTQAVTFSNSATNISLHEDNIANSTSTSPTSSAASLSRNQAYAVVYDYTAIGTSLAVTFTPENAASFHFYGLTNELAPVPEPAGVLAGAGLVLAAGRRLRRWATLVTVA